MRTIQLKKCNLCCFDKKHKLEKYFDGITETNKFIISYKFKGVKNVSYALMQRNITGTGGTVYTIDNNFSYMLGNKCYVTGYCQIEIKNEEKTK